MRLVFVCMLKGPSGHRGLAVAGWWLVAFPTGALRNTQNNPCGVCRPSCALHLARNNFHGLSVCVLGAWVDQSKHSTSKCVRIEGPERIAEAKPDFGRLDTVRIPHLVPKTRDDGHRNAEKYCLHNGTHAAVGDESGAQWQNLELRHVGERPKVTRDRGQTLQDSLGATHTASQNHKDVIPFAESTEGTFEDEVNEVYSEHVHECLAIALCLPVVVALNLARHHSAYWRFKVCACDY
mmetsp:Transcript_34081/g.76973  ORF Transcript_34081/g.76973 Transcript_34081/m.76973 type:complete len:237 (+) Transcript_34081:199-909(+)